MMTRTTIAAALAVLATIGAAGPAGACGSVRDWNEGVGYFATTTSSLIPMLDKLSVRFGESFTDEETALMKRSRRGYYLSGLLGMIGMILTFVLVISQSDS